jgi:arylsulfatase A-like enzyme
MLLLKFQDNLKGTYCDLFYLWSGVMVFAFLPLDILYRIDSMIRYAELTVIVTDASIIIVLFILFAAIISAVNIGIAAILIVCRITIIDKTIVVLNKIIIALSLSIVILKISKIWFMKILDIGYNLPQIDYRIRLILAIIVFFIAIKYRDIVDRAIGINIDRFVVPIRMIAVICILFMLARIISINVKSFGNVLLKSNKPHSNIILVTMDALSAEDMSLYGYHLDTTPYINNFANNSYVFDNMFSNSNWTKPSITSLLTGFRPSTHRLISISDFNIYSKQVSTSNNLIRYLNSINYNSIAIVSNLAYAHPYSNDTFSYFKEMPCNTIDKDFIDNYKKTYKLFYLDKYFSLIKSSANRWIFDMVNDYYPWLNRSLGSFNTTNRWNNTTGYPAEIPFKIAEKFLRTDDSNNFCWIHIFPPHYPYLPPPNYKYHFLQDKVLDTYKKLPTEFVNYKKDQQQLVNNLRLRYDEYLLYADAAFGDFIESLKKNGLYDNSIVILTSDHGESFDRGYFGHGGPYLYQQIIHVPLIIHLPGQKSGKRITTNTEHVDIAPTLLELLGQKVPSSFEGESMTKAMFGDYISDKPKYIMNLEGNSSKGPIRSGQIAVVQGSFKYIYDVTNGREELFNLRVDKHESRNLLLEQKERANFMKSLILRDIINKLN